MSSFQQVEQVWSDRLESLRNVVRQQVIEQQLNGHVEAGSTVLDVGCGQGTQAVRLAKRGCTVVGVDPSRALLEQFQAEAAAAGCSVSGLVGTVDDPDRLLGAVRFNVVCGHGLLMYLPDAFAALRQLAGRVRPGGLLSFTVRNGDALAFRPGMRGQWDAALAAFDADSYVNELGAHARAHRLHEVLGWCAELGLAVEAWYGVRVFTDALPADAAADPALLPACLAAEIAAGRRDPYRRLASQLHVLARAGSR